MSISDLNEDGKGKYGHSAVEHTVIPNIDIVALLVSG